MCKKRCIIWKLANEYYIENTSTTLETPVSRGLCSLETISKHIKIFSKLVASQADTSDNAATT